MADATVTLIGNCTRDPELKFTGTGTAIATIGLAVSKRYQKNNEWVEEVSFFNVTAWGQLGENVAASVEKGTRLVVHGELKQRSYETSEGEKRSVVEINAQAIGPDLRFAEAAITRNERSTSTEASVTKLSPNKSNPFPDEEPF
jgi:single-strand DNA-binding protein